MLTSTTKILCRARNRQSRQISLGRVALLLGVAAAALVGGCARGVATTTVQPTGAWVRTVTFHGTKPSKDGNSFGTPIREAFVLPTGTGWKITPADTKEEAVLVAERTLAPGEILRGDITTKGGKKPPLSVPGNTNTKPVILSTNEVTVQQTAPGVFEYKETFHWKGPAPQNSSMNAEMVDAFKKALPPTLATDANARDLATQSLKDLWHLMFGPGDPLVAQISSLVMQPELVERHVQQRIGTTLEQHLEAKFGTQVTAEQRRAIVRSIIHNALFRISNETKSAAPGSESTDKEDNSPGAALFISVKMPGRITATNGEQNVVNGEVYWALYPEAAALGDVTLTATCTTTPK